MSVGVFLGGVVCWASCLRAVDIEPRIIAARPYPHAPARLYIGYRVFYYYSHSIVAGGLELTSYTTRDTPRTSLPIRVASAASTSISNR